MACLGPKDCNNFLFINIFFSPALGRYSSLHHTVKEYMQTVPAQSWSNIKAESWNWKHLHSPTPEPQTTPETLCGPPQGSPRGSPALSQPCPGRRDISYSQLSTVSHHYIAALFLLNKIFSSHTRLIFVFYDWLFCKCQDFPGILVGNKHKFSQIKLLCKIEYLQKMLFSIHPLLMKAKPSFSFSRVNLLQKQGCLHKSSEHNAEMKDDENKIINWKF